MFARLLSIALIVCSFLLIWQTLPHLPPRIPVHFDFAGRPNGWSSPETLWHMLGMQVLVTLILLAIPAIGRLAPRLVHLGRRTLADFPPATREEILPMVGNMFGCMALIASALFTYMISGILRAALYPGVRLKAWPGLAAVLLMVLMAIYYVWKMLRLARDGSATTRPHLL